MPRSHRRCAMSKARIAVRDLRHATTPRPRMQFDWSTSAARRAAGLASHWSRNCHRRVSDVRRRHRTDFKSKYNCCHCRYVRTTGALAGACRPCSRSLPAPDRRSRRRVSPARAGPMKNAISPMPCAPSAPPPAAARSPPSWNCTSTVRPSRSSPSRRLAATSWAPSCRWTKTASCRRRRCRPRLHDRCRLRQAPPRPPTPPSLRPRRLLVAAPAPAKSGDTAKKWYDKLSLRGYTQIRYNQGIGGDAQDLRAPGDRFIGNDQSLGIRRARLLLSGDLNEHVSLYFQPDFASTPTGSTTSNFAQLRDAYADIFFDKKREYRVRVGQSKMPYGWENLQSSQNRLSLDRADALNSGLRDERDIGAVFCTAPPWPRAGSRTWSSRD